MDDNEIAKNEERINHLLESLALVAGGDLTVRYQPTGSSDQIEALGVGFNMLVEEIEAKFGELERMNKIFVDREVTMHELKQKNKELAAQLEALKSPATT